MFTNTEFLIIIIFAVVVVFIVNIEPYFSYLYCKKEQDCLNTACLHCKKCEKSINFDKESLNEKRE